MVSGRGSVGGNGGGRRSGFGTGMVLVKWW